MSNGTRFGIGLQKRMKAILGKDQPLKDLLGGQDRVLDFIPKGQAFPYVVIGETKSKNFDTHDSNGFEGVTIVRVYTQPGTQKGRLECEAILDRVWLLLHDQEMNVDGRSQINFRCTDSEVVKNTADSESCEGIQTYNFTFGGNGT